LAGERAQIDGANANGGFIEESYKSGVISGAKLGTEYDSTKIIAGDKSTDGVAKFKHGSERIQQTRKDAIDNTLQKGVEETGMTPEEADKAMLAASLGLGGLGINHMLGNPAGKLVNKVRGRKSSSGNSEFVGDSKNKTNNKGSSHQNNESNYAEKNKVSNHGNSSGDIKNYTKEYGQSKEAFQALRGQKGPIRTVAGKAWNLTKSKDSVPDEPSNKANGKNSDGPINQNDSAHDGTSSKNSDTIITEIKKTISQKYFQVKV